MSNIQAAVKAADQIISRIFDQRQFTAGEIIYLNRELGEKGKLEENFSKLLKVDLNLNVTLDSLESQYAKLDTRLMEDVRDQVSSLEKQSICLLHLQEEQRLREDILLAKVREERNKVRQDCVDEMQSKLKDLRETLATEESELERKYLKFEENLRAGK